tara:strand:- start:63 stop:407 length:345 start_codon:yes stop_codon:yes gene_type:complete
MDTDETAEDKKPYFIARGGSIFLYDPENKTLAAAELPAETAAYLQWRLVGPQPTHSSPNWFTELQPVDPYMVLSELEVRRAEIEQAINDLLSALEQIEGATIREPLQGVPVSPE